LSVKTGQYKTGQYVTCRLHQTMALNMLNSLQCFDTASDSGFQCFDSIDLMLQINTLLLKKTGPLFHFQMTSTNIGQYQ